MKTMNLLITSREQILAELTEIDSFLNITMSENAEEAVQRGNDLAVYVARTGKLLADAKYWLNEAVKSKVMQTLVETAKNAKATAAAPCRSWAICSTAKWRKRIAAGTSTLPIPEAWKRM